MAALLLFACGLFFLAVYAVANAVAVLKFGKLYVHPWSDKIPVFRFAFRCVACASAWIGVFGSWFLFSPTKTVFDLLGHFILLGDLPLWKAYLVDGAVASAVSYILYSFTEWLDPTVVDAPVENAPHVPDKM